MEGGDRGEHRAYNGAIVCCHMPIEEEEERGRKMGGEEEGEEEENGGLREGKVGKEEEIGEEGYNRKRRCKGKRKMEEMRDRER